CDFPCLLTTWKIFYIKSILQMHHTSFSILLPGFLSIHNIPGWIDQYFPVYSLYTALSCFHAYALKNHESPGLMHHIGTTLLRYCADSHGFEICDLCSGSDVHYRNPPSDPLQRSHISNP